MTVPVAVAAAVVSLSGAALARPGGARHGVTSANGVPLLAAPRCPTPPASQKTPWLDTSYGPECQAQFVIDDLRDPHSALYETDAAGTPAQSTLQRLVAAVASGENLLSASGGKQSLLELYGLTVSGGGDDGAVGKRPDGLALPSALTLGATFDQTAASTYGTVIGSEFHRTGLSSILAPVIDIDRTYHTGREMENFGEDPYLTGSLVMPEIRSIQDAGVMTIVKHFAAYTQEQGRNGQALDLASTPVVNTGENESVSQRALEEIYGPAWQAAVSPTQGNAMGVMCGYAIVNAHTDPPYTGANSCSNLYMISNMLRGEYGFEGTLSPDAATAQRDGALLNFENGGNGGVAQMTPDQLQSIVGDGSGDQRTQPDGDRDIISTARLVDEVRRIVLQSVKDARYLKQPVNTGLDKGIAAEVKAATSINERGAVLLKNDRGVLPIGRHDRSIAVIGTQAGPNSDTSLGPVSTEMPQVENDGSAYVDPANTFADPDTGQSFGYSSALSGIAAAASPSQQVRYAPGSSGLAELPLLAANGKTSGTGSVVTPDGAHAGFLATYYGGTDPRSPDTVLGTQVVPSIDFTSDGTHTFPAVDGGSPAVAIPTQYQFNNWSASYTGVYTPAHSGDYSLSIAESGTVKLYVDGTLVTQRLRDDFGYVDRAVIHLSAGTPVTIKLLYTPEEAADLPTSVFQPIFTPMFNTTLGAYVHLGAKAPSTRIQRAIELARSSDIAVVFAGREIGEGHDIQSLSLPGDQDALIDAVARANPRTVVVLTGGPVAMPWLNRVAGVLEMWEPGATFGTSVAALLFGRVNPSGRLPITFPASERQGPATKTGQYPGITDLETGASNGFVQLKHMNFSEGVDVGYRYYLANDQKPLFGFGFGLSYTSFDKRIVGRSVDRDGSVVVRVRDTNTGHRTGTDVVQGYVHDPAYTGEPARQLKAFARVTLRPGQSTVVTLRFPASSFAYWNSGPATGTTPSTNSRADGTTQVRQPRGRWVIAPGVYRVDIADSALARASDSTSFRLAGRVRGLKGVFATTPASLRPAPRHGVVHRATRVTLDPTLPGGSNDSSVQYSVDGGPWHTYHRPFTLNRSGTHTLRYRYVTADGLVAGSRSTTFEIDRGGHCSHRRCHH